MIVQQGDNTLDTFGWLRWAETDYLGARILLLTDLLAQGSALANTAIEKFLKAFFSYSGLPVPRGHDVEKLYLDLKAKVPGCKIDLNVEFLNFVTKAYTLRYPDDLEEGFNIVINQAKVLAQLDRTVQEIGNHLKLELRGKTQRMVLDPSRENNDTRYFDRNVAADPSKVSSLFAGKSECCEIRVHRQMIIEAFYESDNIPDDLVFNRPGLNIEPQNPKSFRMAYYKPIE